MPSAARPKPSYEGGKKPPYGPFLDWLDRQFTEVLGAEHKTLEQRLDAIVEDIDLSAIEGRLDDAEADIATHETRLDDLEAGEASFKTTGYSQAYTSVGATAATTFYWRPFGDAATVPGTVLATGQIVWGRQGTIKNLRFNNTNPTGDADTFTLSLNVNGSDTALTIPNLSGSTSTLQSDTTHSVSVAVGDLVCFSQVNAGAHNVGSQPRLWFDFEET